MAQLAITIPLLMLGHDHDAGMHAAHELGSFDLALAIAFAVGAIRPALSAGLAWPSGIAAAGLVGTAVVDMVSGQTIGADEAQHLIALAGAPCFWQARTAVPGSRGGHRGGHAARRASGRRAVAAPAGPPIAGRRQRRPRQPQRRPGRRRPDTADGGMPGAGSMRSRPAAG